MQFALDFKPLPEGFSFEPNKKHYANNELKNTNKLISFLYKSRAGYKGELTKIKNKQIK